jgi:hypothetical protein
MGFPVLFFALLSLGRQTSGKTGLLFRLLTGVYYFDPHFECGFYLF